MLQSLFNKVAGLQALLKRDSNTGAFLWFCEIFKKTFFYKIPPVAASDSGRLVNPLKKFEKSDNNCQVIFQRLEKWDNSCQVICQRSWEYSYFLWSLLLELQIQKLPPEVFCKKGVLRNFAKFTEKHLCQRIFF